jgi:hypothetical protein
LWTIADSADEMPEGLQRLRNRRTPDLTLNSGDATLLQSLQICNGDFEVPKPRRRTSKRTAKKANQVSALCIDDEC